MWHFYGGLFGPRPVICPTCGWMGQEEDLHRYREAEMYHPKNRDKGPGDELYLTDFQTCPMCDRVLLADGIARRGVFGAQET